MSDHELSAAQFRALYDRVKLMSRWGPADRRGALNNIAPAQVTAAAGGVRRGRSVSLAAPIESTAATDNPDPAVHLMTRTGISPAPASGLSFAMDRLAMNIHGNADSHIDALCHVMFDGTLYNGIDAHTVTAAGASELSIEVASDGIVGRGLLLDIPRVRRMPWLEPGDHVTADDLITAEAEQQVRIEQGDLLFVRVGHRSRRRALGPGTPRLRAPGCIRWPWNSSRNGGSRCSAATATTTRPRARPRASTFPYTCSPSTRWGCISWTGCSSMTSSQYAKS